MIFKSIIEIPRSALILGFSGLIPFVFFGGMALYQAPNIQPEIYPAIITYGAIILSFLGGVRWGIAINRHNSASLFQPLIVSVIPPLVGWFAIFMKADAGLLLLLVSFLLMLLLDLKAHYAPAWYLTLRIPLSLVVLVSLSTVLII